MSKNSRLLNIVVEEQYSNTIWYNQIYGGICKAAGKNSISLHLCSLSELSSLDAGDVVVLLGSSLPFIVEQINSCTRLNLRPIIAGFEIFESSLQFSYITINRRQAMFEVVKALISRGAGRIALLGINSSIQTDMLRFHGWCDAATAYQIGSPDKDVYYSDVSPRCCLDSFWQNYDSYDAVACANDYYAVMLCSEANERGIKIPDTLMVTGFGNTQISRYTRPALTTVDLNLSLVGIQVIVLFRLLLQHPDLLACTAALESKIVFRQSTRPKQQTVSNNYLFPGEMASPLEPAYNEQLTKIYSLENTVTTMDEMDKKIITGLLNNKSYGKLAEELFLSDTAFNYRLHKLFTAAGCKKRSELITFFQTYIPAFADSDH